MKSVFKKKIILGSANFNQKYGIKKNFIKKKEIKKLLNFALKNKINTIDTSPNYKHSEKIIGELGNGRFKIISKIPKLPKNIKKKNIEKWIKKKVTTSVKNLKIKKLEYLLLQDVKSLMSKNGNLIYKSLKNIKTNGFTKKIGISIYDFNTLENILKNFNFDLIQAPFNILDQRLIKNGWLNKIKSKNIKIHVRSIFLQGILLLNNNDLPPRLKNLKKKWIIWEKWLIKNKHTSLQACLSFIFNQSKVNGVVMGYNNKDQLDQILRQKQIGKKFIVPKFNIQNRKMIDPREWNNK